ncbi:hypothetical protein BD410DRAFT_738109 [Rickenella mellea]|uniref:Carbohydrate kinase PfkB domain-containing protein n=1 Tax=Rickenella mellea TaxID=50990 RepID=A0A4Y7QNX1_9AGAM|nr:hypothetical protein BD410DRAFT_738109 [Rickenella mellea]
MLHRHIRSCINSLHCRRRYSQVFGSNKNSLPIDIHPEICDAHASSKPVVALESALITHGLPQPVNLHTALSLQRTVKATGAVPATIGIIDGRIKIGLNDAELERLANVADNRSCVKLSVRDIAPCLALKRDGGTTISATLHLAAHVGIKVVATGGLGGVHRGGENTMDVSADLYQLVHSPVTLVTGGIKSILDIGRHGHPYESLGVPVVTFGRSNDFPAFYSPKSGFKSPWNTDDPRVIAEIMDFSMQLRRSGVFVAVPIPEKYEAEGAEIQKSVEQALRDSVVNGVSMEGNRVTPWLLDRVAQLTGGKSIRSNVALLETAAATGAKIAIQYQHRLNECGSTQEQIDHTDHCAGQTPSPTLAQSHERLVVVGASAIDVTANMHPDYSGMSDYNSRTTAPGEVTVTLGGVGRNIAEAAHRIFTATSGIAPQRFETVLLSPVGNDIFGRSLLDSHQQMGMRNYFVQSPHQRTAVCNLVLSGLGMLVTGVADIDIMNDFDATNFIDRLAKQRPKLVAMDANLLPSNLATLLIYCVQNNIHTLYEPTSVTKSANILPALLSLLKQTGPYRSPVTYASPNVNELAQMYRMSGSEQFNLFGDTDSIWWSAINDLGLGSDWRADIEKLAKLSASPHSPDNGTLSFLAEEGVVQMAVNLLPFFQHLIIKCGRKGVVVVMRIPRQDVARSGWVNEESNPLERSVVWRGSGPGGMVVLKHFPPHSLDKDSLVSDTGAGDSLVGVVCAHLVQNQLAFQRPADLHEIMTAGQQAALLSLQCPTAISPLLGN